MSIRRANLDAINGKSRNTISGHKRRTRELVDNAVRINKTPTLEPRGPFPLVDQVGMGLAVDIIQKSLVTSGRNEKVIQAETLRQLRSTFTKNWESSPKGVAESASFGSGQGRVRPTSCPAQSEWYQDFWRGVEKRMGHKSLANHALEMAAMVKCIELIKADAATAESEEASAIFGIHLKRKLRGSFRNARFLLYVCACGRVTAECVWGSERGIDECGQTRIARLVL